MNTMDVIIQPDKTGLVQEETCISQPSTSAPCERRHLRVGCALLPKKVARYLTPTMTETAAAQGVELHLLDHRRPIVEQGLFDGIIHKLRPNKEWEANLTDYAKQHPEVIIIDHLERIKTLQNRSTMLFPVQGDGIVVQPAIGKIDAQDRGECVRIRAPEQVEILEGTSADAARHMVEEAGLTTPLLIKPLWSDGREGSHGLAVLHDIEALGKVVEGRVSPDLKPPLVVQQFVDHGGVLFKVYVLGSRTVVTKRPSLGDAYLGLEARRKGVLQLPRISCKAVCRQARAIAADAASGPDCPQMAAAVMVAAKAHAEQEKYCQRSLPPDWMTHALADELRCRLHMQLFNFDLICPLEQPNPHETLYYVIDINYFPGVDKIANFETVFVEFLREACTQGSEGEGDSGSSRRQQSGPL